MCTVGQVIIDQVGTMGGISSFQILQCLTLLIFGCTVLVINQAELIRSGNIIGYTRNGAYDYFSKSGGWHTIFYDPERPLCMLREVKVDGEIFQ